MKARRYPQRTQAGALWPELIDLLLHGWGAHPTAPYPDDPDVDQFAIFDMREADFARIFREHEPTLRAEWQRRGGPGEPWAARLTHHKSTGRPT